MAELVEGGLTGARRFRVMDDYRNSDESWHWGGKPLILEVQYNTWVPASETKPEGHWGTLWRDATPDDITSAEEVV